MTAKTIFWYWNGDIVHSYCSYFGEKLLSSNPKEKSEVPCVAQLKNRYQQQRIGFFSQKFIEGFYSLEEDCLFATPKWFID